MRKKRGAVLFLAIGALSVLSILTLGVTSAVLQELKLAQSVTDANTSIYPALSCAEAARIILARDDTPDNVILYDLRPRVFSLGDKTVEVRYSDEEGKVFIDTAPKEVLMRLPGLAENEAVVDALVAAQITTKEDIFSVEGMSEELTARFGAFVTVSGEGKINVNTAPLEVLESQGMDEDLIQKIRAFRSGDDAEEATQDDKFFAQPSDIIPRLEPYGLTDPQRMLLEALISSSRLATTSRFLTYAVAVKKGTRTAMSYEMVQDLNSGDIIFYSQE